MENDELTKRLLNLVETFEDSLSDIDLLTDEVTCLKKEIKELAEENESLKHQLEIQKEEFRNIEHIARIFS